MKIDVPALLLWARQEFPKFFCSADPNEVRLIEALVVAHTALLLAIKSESLLGKQTTNEIKIRSHALEADYTKLREMVRESKAFSSLSTDEKNAMEMSLLTIPFD